MIVCLNSQMCVQQDKKKMCTQFIIRVFEANFSLSTLLTSHVDQEMKENGRKQQKKKGVTEI